MEYDLSPIQKNSFETFFAGRLQSKRVDSKHRKAPIAIEGNTKGWAIFTGDMTQIRMPVINNKIEARRSIEGEKVIALFPTIKNNNAPNVNAWGRNAQMYEKLGPGKKDITIDIPSIISNARHFAKIRKRTVISA